MAEYTHLALFNDVDAAAEALDALRSLGIGDDQIEVMSGVPYTEHVLGRPKRRSYVGKVVLIGASIGFIVSLLLNWGTPLLYPLRVGGQPLLPVPPTVVLTFEFTMMGLFLSGILTLIWENWFPAWGPVVYHEKVSDGRIALIFQCPPDLVEQAYAVLQERGAELVERTEAKKR